MNSFYVLKLYVIHHYIYIYTLSDREKQICHVISLNVLINVAAGSI